MRRSPAAVALVLLCSCATFQDPAAQPAKHRWSALRFGGAIGHASMTDEADDSLGGTAGDVRIDVVPFSEEVVDVGLRAALGGISVDDDFMGVNVEISGTELFLGPVLRVYPGSVMGKPRLYLELAAGYGRVDGDLTAEGPGGSVTFDGDGDGILVILGLGVDVPMERGSFSIGLDARLGTYEVEAGELGEGDFDRAGLGVAVMLGF